MFLNGYLSSSGAFFLIRYEHVHHQDLSPNPSNGNFTCECAWVLPLRTTNKNGFPSNGAHISAMFFFGFEKRRPMPIRIVRCFVAPMVSPPVDHEELQHVATGVGGNRFSSPLKPSPFRPTIMRRPPHINPHSPIIPCRWLLDSVGYNCCFHIWNHSAPT